jgi:hypothetical protein
MPFDDMGGGGMPGMGGMRGGGPPANTTELYEVVRTRSTREWKLVVVVIIVEN